jgi:hypothetical protein
VIDMCTYMTMVVINFTIDNVPMILHIAHDQGYLKTIEHIQIKRKYHLHTSSFAVNRH